MGHEVEMLTGWERSMFGRGQVVRRHWDVDGGKEGEGVGVWSAGSDGRGDGCAMPA
jgi:gamma-glutamyltranspeptidase / glutathione hydrolase